MDIITDFINHNSTITMVIGIILLIISGFILRKIKTLAILFIIISAFLFFILINKGTISKSKIDQIKKNTKQKVIENINK